MSLDLSGSGTTAEWATVGVALIAVIAAALLTWKQIAIMNKQQTIIEAQEKRQKKAKLVASFRKIPIQPPEQPLGMRGLSSEPLFEMEIRNIGPADARKIRVVTIGICDMHMDSTSPLVPDLIAGDKFTQRLKDTRDWQKIVVFMEWVDDSGEEGKNHKELSIKDIREA